MGRMNVDAAWERTDGQSERLRAWVARRWVPPDLAPVTDPEVLRGFERYADNARRMLADVRTKRGGAPHLYADWIPHEKQARIWYSQARRVVVTTSTRWGKSNCGGALNVMRATGIPPEWFLAPERLPYLAYLPWCRERKPWQGIVIGPMAGPRDKGVGRYVVNMLPEEWVEEIRRDQQRRVSYVRVFTGAEINFLAQDQNIGAAMSVNVDWIHEDEELEGELGEAIRDELMSRLTDRVGRYIATFTAVNSALRGCNTKIMREVVKPFREGKLDRREFEVFRGSIDDNVYLSDEAIDAHKNAYRHPVTRQPDPWKWPLYVEGDPVGVNLSPVIDVAALVWQREHVMRPHEEQGDLTDAVTWQIRGDNAPASVPGWQARAQGLTGDAVTFVPAPAGQLYLWRRPERGHHYTIGVDVGHGVRGGNPSVAAVFDRTPGEFVALLYGLTHPTRLLPALLRLGHWYNRAWLCVEDADAGVKVVGDLAGAGLDAGYQLYPRLYLHDRPGGYVEMTKRPGYPMGVETKAYMLATINGALTPEHPGRPETMPVKCPIARVLEEWGEAYRDEKGVVDYPRVPEGDMVRHGDCLVAAGLALVAHRSPSCPLPFDAPKREPLADVRAELAMREYERLQREGAFTIGGKPGSRDGWERVDTSAWQAERIG